MIEQRAFTYMEVRARKHRLQVQRELLYAPLAHQRPVPDLFALPICSERNKSKSSMMATHLEL